MGAMASTWPTPALRLTPRLFVLRRNLLPYAKPWSRHERQNVKLLKKPKSLTTAWLLSPRLRMNFGRGSNPWRTTGTRWVLPCISTARDVQLTLRFSSNDRSVTNRANFRSNAIVCFNCNLSSIMAMLAGHLLVKTWCPVTQGETRRPLARRACPNAPPT